MDAPSEFADAVRTLARAEVLRTEYGRRNRTYFEENFTWDRIADSFLSFTG
jgi:glycosyltransferase involved in cell wall biosynthesis